MNILTDQSLLLGFFDYVDRVYYDPEEGDWTRPYGNCTHLNSSIAQILREHGHAVEIMGADDSVMSKYWDLPCGHDWLLVDGEIIVDIWIHAYLNPAETRATYTSADSQYHPPRHEWEPPTVSFEKWFAESAQDWRNYLSTA